MENTKRNVEIVTEVKEASVITGAKVFISIEDARVILGTTNILPKPEGNTPEFLKRSLPVDPDDLNMLYNCRSLVRFFAKAVLYSPVNEDIKLGDIVSKYV